MKFSLFGRHEPDLKVINKVWTDTNAKWKACSSLLSQQSNVIFIAWFEETVHQFKSFLAEAGQAGSRVILAREAGTNLTQQGSIIFIEHHPMKSKEHQMFEKMGLKEAVIYCSLDEPFFTAFGGEKLIEIMHTLGVKEDECIEHSMVTKAISNAQEKIEQRMIVEQSATSQKAWMERNLNSTVT